MRDPGGVCKEERIVCRPLAGRVGIHFLRLSPFVPFRKQDGSGKLKRDRIKKKKSCVDSGPKPSHSFIHSFSDLLSNYGHKYCSRFLQELNVSVMLSNRTTAPTKGNFPSHIPA